MRSTAAKIGVVVLVAAAAAHATEGEVDYRQHTMAAVGGHMQAIADILRGKVSHTSHLATHANAMAGLAAIAPALFPAGSDGGDALAAIWEDAEDFKAKLDAFKEAADGFKAAAASGEMAAVGPAMQSLGQACKGCHDSYRAE